MTELPSEKHGFENDMSTPIHRALHYVECYALHFPHSGALSVAEELLQMIMGAKKRTELIFGGETYELK